MFISLEDELLVALFDRQRTDAGRPAIASEPFSVAALTQLTGRSAKAVEEALFDMHRAGTAKVVPDVKNGAAHVVDAHLTDPVGALLVAGKLTVVYAAWESRENDRAGPPRTV